MIARSYHGNYGVFLSLQIF